MSRCPTGRSGSTGPGGAGVGGSGSCALVECVPRQPVANDRFCKMQQRLSCRWEKTEQNISAANSEGPSSNVWFQTLSHVLNSLGLLFLFID